jgi:hypothetical protein
MQIWGKGHIKVLVGIGVSVKLELENRSSCTSHPLVTLKCIERGPTKHSEFISEDARFDCRRPSGIAGRAEIGPSVKLGT